MMSRWPETEATFELINNRMPEETRRAQFLLLAMFEVGELPRPLITQLGVGLADLIENQITNQ
jgi:hypothetical protein